MQLLVTGLIGLLGVMVGAFLNFVMEVWRVVLGGRASARVVRLEMQANANKCVQAIHSRDASIRLSDTAWLTHREQLANVLPEEAFRHVSIGYDAMFIVQQRITEIGGDNFSFCKSELEQWAKRLLVHCGLFKQIERRRRLAQMLDVFLGRTTFPTGEKKGPPPPIVLPNLDEMK